jgi:hypothetical protein
MHHVCAALTQAEEALTKGALLTVSPKRARLRRDCRSFRASRPLFATLGTVIFSRNRRPQAVDGP